MDRKQKLKDKLDLIFSELELDVDVKKNRNNKKRNETQKKKKIIKNSDISKREKK